MNIWQLPGAQLAALPESFDIFLLAKDVVSLPEKVNKLWLIKMLSVEWVDRILQQSNLPWNSAKIEAENCVPPRVSYPKRAS